MRSLLMMVTLVACSCDASNAAAPTAERPARTTVVPRHGGAIVTLDGHPLELVALGSGTLHVHVLRDDQELDGVTVRPPTADGVAHAIAMHRMSSMFVGRFDGRLAAGEAVVHALHESRSLSATVEVTRILPAPSHGGAVLWLGDAPVEVRVDADGHAELWTPDGSQLDGELTLGIPGDDGEVHPLVLAWDASRYAGRIEGMTPSPGPLEVVLDSGDTQTVGRGALIEVPAAPTPNGPFEGLQLELPELGSDLPAVIAVPPPEAG